MLRNDCSLFSRLFIACQTRKGNLPEFFRHENQPVPPALSKNGEMRTGQKSDLLHCLECVVGCDSSLVYEPRGEKFDDELPTTDDTGFMEVPDLRTEDILHGLEKASCLENPELKEDLLLACSLSSTHVTKTSARPKNAFAEVDARILDGAFIVQLLSPKTSRTFQE